jgi:hypothetical protein
MTESVSGDPDPEWHGDADPGPSNRPRAGLAALIVDSEDGPACTIYPPDVAAPYRTTAWMTAHGASFVDLEERR